MKAGLVVDSTPDDPSVYAPGGYEDVPYSWLQGFATNVDESLRTSIGPSAYRWADRHWGEDNSPMLTASEANEKYGIPDQLSFETYTNGVSERTAQELRTAKQQEIRQASIVRRSGLGWLGRLTSGVVGGVLDPANIAMAVAPELLLTRLGVLGEATTLGARVRQGAVVGAAGNAPGIPANYLFAQDEQRDYGVADALMDLTVGAAIGGAAPLLSEGARSVFGRVRNRVAGRADPVAVEPAAVAYSSPEMRLESLTTALQQKLNGFPVDLQPVVASVNATDDMAGQVTRALREAQARGVAALTDTLRGLSAPEARRAGLSPYGSTAFDDGAQRVNLSWGVVGDAKNVVSPEDINRIDRVATGMVPVEETADTTTWRTVRQDGRVVEYTLKDTAEDGKPVQNWNVKVVPGTRKNTQLSQFIDGTAPEARAVYDATQPGVLTPQQVQSNLVDQNNALGQFRGSITSPGETTRTPLPDISQPAPSVIRPDDATALARAEAMLASSPSVKARAPDEGMGASSPDTRELDELAMLDEQALDQLRKAGRLSESDENALSLNTAEDKVRKERSKARDFAYTCLLQNGEGDLNG